MSQWYSPPTRRELSLLLFSFAVFVLFYNLPTSVTSRTTLRTANKDPDQGSQTFWDDVIYGNWTQEEEQVRENALKQGKDKTSVQASVTVSFHPHVFGSVGVNEGILDWNDEVPITTVLKHVPGYTIMDNVFMLNGTLFIVTDDPSFPPLSSIASSSEDSNASPLPSEWRMLSSAQARDTLGTFGGLIHGVSWLVTDASPGNYTLFSLWRTYSALDTSLSPDAPTLPPPRRVFYPNVLTLMGVKPEIGEPILPRQRFSTGIHPLLAKAAFPTLGQMYKEDWADYALPHIPFMIQRVVVADQGAARRARTDIPSFAVPLIELEAADVWWEPIRRNVARSLGVAEDVPKLGWFSKPETIVTYLSRQDAANGPKASQADHDRLIKELGELGRGYTVHVVPVEAPWIERMRAIAQSTVIIGVYGEHMADSVYIPPSSRAAVMELFPSGVFVRDAAMSVQAIGVRYIAWREGRQYDVEALPPDAPPEKGNKDEVPIDVSALMKVIRWTG